MQFFQLRNGAFTKKNQRDVEIFRRHTVFDRQQELRQHQLAADRSGQFKSKKAANGASAAEGVSDPEFRDKKLGFQVSQGGAVGRTNCQYQVAKLHA